MLYLIYCVGRFASGFVHRSAYYISLRLTACPIYCVLVLHLLGSTRTSGTGANLILLSVFLYLRVKEHSQQRLNAAPTKHICSTSLCSNRCLSPGKPFENFTCNFWVLEMRGFPVLLEKSVWIHLCHLVPGGILRCPPPTGGHTGHLSPAAPAGSFQRVLFGSRCNKQPGNLLSGASLLPRVTAWLQSDGRTGCIFNYA